jgi:hypothetical protein
MGQSQNRISDGGAGATRKNALGEGKPSGEGGVNVKNAMGGGTSVKRSGGAAGGKNNMRSGKG